MKCSESWLRQWVNPPIQLKALADQLTLCGLEVESIESVKTFSGVVVGQVNKVEKHPNADSLKICEVNIGATLPLSIVCGAKNVREGLKVAVAVLGAVLPKITIKSAQIRGISSEGMLCSADELGLTEESEGLIELPQDAPLGITLIDYFNLDDSIIDISITPNRGDCLSIRGLAREVAAVTGTPLKTRAIPSVAPSIEDKLNVSVANSQSCPHYVGRIIRGINTQAKTPVWLKECLRRNGIRSIHPVVDITNFVMLELGAPMHAFDINKITGNIQVRYAHSNEALTLLDGNEKTLTASTLVIADDNHPLAIAGVMGGLHSSITALSENIFLESAYFDPKTIAKQCQVHQLNSDSAYRFERGVDYTLQHHAIERATQLILEILGGAAGPVISYLNDKDLPQKPIIFLERKKIYQVLGIAIERDEVNRILSALHFEYQENQNGYEVMIPAWRFDLLLPEDLIEEIARLFGYDKIPVHIPVASIASHSLSINQADLWRQAFCSIGFHEVISYSFISREMHDLLHPGEYGRELINPISTDMKIMRTSLWPGLLNVLSYNEARQQHRFRLFEMGHCFREQEVLCLGGIMAGSSFPESWANPTREVDFFDVKGVLEQLFGRFNLQSSLTFKASDHPTLHPGQTAAIYCHNQQVGVLGLLHPKISQYLDRDKKVYLFELRMDQLPKSTLNSYHDISKFPEIRRDIAILVNEAIPVEEIQATIKGATGDWLNRVFVFDVYEGKEIPSGQKSVALALILQHPTRTLVDEEVNATLEKVITRLKESLGAQLRS